MQTKAVLLRQPETLALESVPLRAPTPDQVLINVHYSGISTGTEKLFYKGEMPPFPGMGYPLVPGYEAAGEVVEAPKDCAFKVGDFVFVPGANCFDGAYGLFGGAAASLVSSPIRLTRMDAAHGPKGALLALAATAYHAIAAENASLPQLIVGHGVLGRLLARLTIALGGEPPVVWEIDKSRQGGADGYSVIRPERDERRDYTAVCDASGNPAVIDSLIVRLARGGEVNLAGFYKKNISFAFPPAFMAEARLRISAEWGPSDMAATVDLIESGALSLEGLITHTASPHDAPDAYETAFNDPTCLKMILDWRTYDA